MKASEDKLRLSATVRLNKTGTDSLTINRFGILVTDDSSANQCKDVHHKHYRYQVSVTCENKLDNKGFIIDHIDIDHRVRHEFTKGMSSCEQLLVRIMDGVQDLMQSRGLVVYKMYGKLQPVSAVPSEEYAFMEMNRTI